MDVNPPPAIHLFEVWFIPAAGASLRLGAPLRIGQPLSDQDNALALAEVAATDLPAYGFPRGQVLIQSNASVVRVLPTTTRSASHPAASSSRGDGAAACPANSQREVARLALEDLRQQVSRARPTQTAPAAWIACLNQALRVVAGPDDQRRYRLDGLPGVTVDTLHQRVLAVLQQFDQLATENMPPPPTPDGGPVRTR